METNKAIQDLYGLIEKSKNKYEETKKGYEQRKQNTNVQQNMHLSSFYDGVKERLKKIPSGVSEETNGEDSINNGEQEDFSKSFSQGASSNILDKYIPRKQGEMTGEGLLGVVNNPVTRGVADTAEQFTKDYSKGVYGTSILGTQLVNDVRRLFGAKGQETLRFNEKTGKTEAYDRMNEADDISSKEATAKALLGFGGALTAGVKPVIGIASNVIIETLNSLGKPGQNIVGTLGGIQDVFGGILSKVLPEGTLDGLSEEEKKNFENTMFNLTSYGVIKGRAKQQKALDNILSKTKGKIPENLQTPLNIALAVYNPKLASTKLLSENIRSKIPSGMRSKIIKTIEAGDKLTPLQIQVTGNAISREYSKRVKDYEDKLNSKEVPF